MILSQLLGEGTMLPISIICEIAITARIVCRSPGKGKQRTSRKAEEAAVPHLKGLGKEGTYQVTFGAVSNSHSKKVD